MLKSSPFAALGDTPCQCTLNDLDVQLSEAHDCGETRRTSKLLDRSSCFV